FAWHFLDAISYRETHQFDEKLSASIYLRAARPRPYGGSKPVGGRSLGAVYHRPIRLGRLSLPLLAHFFSLFFDFRRYSLLCLPASFETRLPERSGTFSAHSCSERRECGSRVGHRLHGSVDTPYVSDGRLYALLSPFSVRNPGALR